MKPFQLTADWATAHHSAPRADDGGPKINLLIVDDQPANLTALEALLGGEGYSIVKASSGHEALRCMLRQEFALVLLDVLMPGMDGFETAELMRRRPQSMHTPIIFITATSTNDTHVSRGYSLGAVDYLYKPIVPEILKAKVHVFVELYRKTERLARSEEALRRELEQNRRSEEARRESEEKYRKLFSRASDAIVVLDAAGEDLLDANRAAQKLYGYTRREMLKLRAGDLSVEEDEESAGAKTATGRNRIFIRSQRRKDGCVFPAEITYGTVSLRGKNMIMMLARDVTERRRAEEAERLRERALMQRQVVATVSHELRTPVAAIKASAETLRINGFTNSRTRPRFLQIIEMQADRLGGLVEDLLILAELESGKFKPAPRRVVLREFVDEILPGAALLAKRKDVSIETDLDESAVVWADLSHVTGIFQNLIDNAVKYNKKGGSIIIGGRRINDREVQVFIRDTGIGIPPADLPLIFQQFHRSKKAREMSIKGTGLGLYIIKTMVEANGGRIWAESMKDQGSVFHFTLPRPEEPAAE